MTPKYWFRIIFGMLAIFFVGMLVRSTVHKGRRAIGAVTHGSGPITIPLLGMGFKLDNERLGSLQKLRIERNAPKLVTGFHLYATLDDTAAIARFNDCRLTVSNPDNIDENTSFRCASAEDSTSEEMVNFGSVTLMPSGKVLTLYIPESVRRDIQKNNMGERNDGDSGNVEMNEKDGSFDLKVNGKSIVSSTFDSNGGHFIVHSEQGKEVVNLKVQAPPAPATPVKRP